MSVVACKLSKDGYTIAADSIAIRGYTQTRGVGSQSKLFSVNGFDVGSCGLFEEVALFRAFCSTRSVPSPTDLTMLDFVVDFSDWKNKKINKPDIENSYIVGVGHKIFFIHGFFVDTVKDYEAIGAGMDYALAAMYLGHTPKKAVETAIELSIYCESPVQIITRGRWG